MYELKFNRQYVKSKIKAINTNSKPLNDELKDIFVVNISNINYKDLLVIEYFEDEKDYEENSEKVGDNRKW